MGMLKKKPEKMKEWKKQPISKQNFFQPMLSLFYIHHEFIEFITAQVYIEFSLEKADRHFFSRKC